MLQRYVITSTTMAPASDNKAKELLKYEPTISAITKRRNAAAVAINTVRFSFARTLREVLLVQILLNGDSSSTKITSPVLVFSTGMVVEESTRVKTERFSLNPWIYIHFFEFFGCFLLVLLPACPFFLHPPFFLHCLSLKKCPIHEVQKGASATNIVSLIIELFSYGNIGSYLHVWHEFALLSLLLRVSWHCQNRSFACTKRQQPSFLTRRVTNHESQCC